MLENEPTTTSENSSADSAVGDADAATPRRRRPVKKVADASAPAEAATPAPTRRRTAKKTAAAPPAALTFESPVLEATDPAGPLVDEAPASRPAKRTRATKKTAAAVTEAPAESDGAAVVQPARASAPRIPSVLFQAPDPESVPAPVRPRRTRSTAGTVNVEPAAAETEISIGDESTAATDADLDQSDGVDGTDRDGTGPRRRRRGGRGRRGGTGTGSSNAAGSNNEATEAAPSGTTSEDAGLPDAEGDDSEEDGDETHEGSASSRRRRRRRRRGSGPELEAETGAPDDPPNTVVRVRAPREHDETDVQGVKGVKGSTRLEAKKQRRREGREQGRGGRRGSVITEAEFLARRESVDRVMVVRQRGDRTQIGVLEDGVLVEHFVSTAATQRMVGNVYLGRVQNVLSGMEAAFVDIGKGRNAVLYAGEVNFDTSGLEGQPRRIESALKPGQPVLVQVTKDSIGHKGARLTSQISLPGRYLVYVPEGSMMGISRKLPDVERGRLKAILKKITPEGAGVIVRTAAEGASEEELTADVARLTAQWEDIKKKSENTTNAPVLLYGEPDLTVRVIRDVFNEDFNSLVVQADSEWDVVENYVGQVAADLVPRLSHWTSEEDIFTHYRLDEQLAKALDRKVWLPSGGYLVIDRTEAMIVIDVNTGRFVGKGGNLEETVTKNNLEAAEEIVRQLRLRDIGGIIVIDFIDMVLESNRDLVLRRLVECLGRDRTKHQVAEVTSLGLVQMTRKRVGNGLLEAFSETCEHCNGRGVIVHTDLVEQKPGRPDGESGRGQGQQSRGGSNNKQGTPSRAAQQPRRTRGGAPSPLEISAMIGNHDPSAHVYDDVVETARAEALDIEPLETLLPGELPGTAIEPAAAEIEPEPPIFVSSNPWTNLAEIPAIVETVIDHADGEQPSAVLSDAEQPGGGELAAGPAAGSGRSRRGGRRRSGAKAATGSPDAVETYADADVPSSNTMIEPL